MDPSATLERIREAYGTSEHDEIAVDCEDLLNWIRRSDQDSYTITEPQLSALLIMAIGYADSQLITQAPD